MKTPSILFVDGLWVEKFGIMSLVPHLQQDGWRVGWVLTRNRARLQRYVREFKPDYLAFSVTTGYHEKALEMARLVKARWPETKTVFGGPHVTYFPELALAEEVDYAFRGECDRELPAALRMLAAGAAPETVPNLVFEGGGSFGVAQDDRLLPHSPISFGPLSPLTEDLDLLPFPDRELLYARYRFFRASPYRQFMVSRGCPHDCAFCFNHKLKDTYRGKGRFVRLRSPESIIDEALAVKNRWGMKLASFEDDLLTFNRPWLEKLLTLWRRKVGTPYNLNGMAGDLADEELVRLLKDTGAWCVAFGVETGNEELRSALLNKRVSNAQIEEAGRLLNAHGVNFLTYNMLALPGETLGQARETLRLNRSIGARLARYTIFQPYPGTQLGDRAATPVGREMHYHESPLAEKEARRIARLQKYALAGMRSPAGERLAVAASFVPAGPLPDLFFYASYFDVVRRYMKTGYRHLAELGLRSLTDLL